MEIGLIGLPNSGKTTVFNALTRERAEVSAFSNHRVEPNEAVIDVLDERVERLSQMYRPRKTTYATVKIIDFVGIAKETRREGLFPPAVMNLIKGATALALVVRNFADDLLGPPTVLEDIRSVEEELILSDLIVAEKRVERLEKAFKKGVRSPETELEFRALQKILTALNDGRAIRKLELEPAEEKALRSFQFLSQKPLLVIVNSDEARFGNSAALLAEIEKSWPAIEFAGKFEMELAGFEDEAEAREFMLDLGIEESARARLTRFVHEILGYISFFTVGEDEVRAWNIPRGATAVEAAGAIHSDLARGFIRAECFSCDALLEAGSEKAVRQNGHFRLEGREYVVQDGDILSIRFAV